MCSQKAEEYVLNYDLLLKGISSDIFFKNDLYMKGIYLKRRNVVALKEKKYWNILNNKRTNRFSDLFEQITNAFNP